MSDKPVIFPGETADHLECYQLLCDLMGGAHHVPKVTKRSAGIKCNFWSSQFATFDFDYLTRLVVMAHDRCIRAEIAQGGPGKIGIVLHKRHKREGAMYERHPTMEQAIERARQVR